MKKIIIIIVAIIFMTLMVSNVYALSLPNIVFWRESRMEPHPDYENAYAYIPSNDQFEVDGCGPGTVLDHEHNLCWDANGNRFGHRTWEQVNNYNLCEGLNLGDIGVGD